MSPRPSSSQTLAPFRPIESEKLAAAVIRQIEGLILRGVLRPGDRLPPERDLAERLGVSRPSLREAIADLSSRGLLESRAGSGVYVDAALGQGFAPALIALFASHETALDDHVAFRRDLEGLAAARAARAGSETDLALIDAVFGKMEAAAAKGDAEAEARLDADFHMAIAEASHNAVMLHVMRATLGLLREAVARNRAVMFRQRTTGGALLDQHRAINAAIQSRDAEGARGAMEGHLDYVRGRLRDQREAAAHEAVARARLAQEEAGR
ncbi:FadR family transcriptional regulator [Jannaschia sp. Os4]|uniref:FadR/GntR family transcriptional regulator n=1 Tax=Jannaschia sp. Os4 TaxID=2807617 RepID=UPI001939E1F7|nr:FadR/GntR family transcriptional regulator [Jannaschia sp. Os4]MBM2575072.1 FadR family transcriptional regulator [Jannaschia sp. Os4]